MRYVKWILGGFLVVTGLALMTGTLSQVGFNRIRMVNSFVSLKFSSTFPEFKELLFILVLNRIFSYIFG